MAEAERLTFALADVVAAVEFTPERRQEPIRWLVLDRRETTVGGVPAVVVDYTFDGPNGSRFGREAYFVHDNHQFVATFIGLKKDGAGIRPRARERPLSALSARETRRRERPAARRMAMLHGARRVPRTHDADDDQQQVHVRRVADPGADLDLDQLGGDREHDHAAREQEPRA